MILVMASQPKLSIVTVTFNNRTGLEKTINSIRNVTHENCECWIIDNRSSDGTLEFLNAIAQHWVHWISEPDNGLYDAMNKALTKISGDYALFINSGDLLLESFSWSTLSQSPEVTAGKVLIGQTIEKYGKDRYLRPGKGKESLFLNMPPHQATFYPRTFFQQAQYRLDMPIGADGEYTARAVEEKGVVFVPQIVCEFELGGLSSSYSSMKVIGLRWQENKRLSGRAKLVTKVILWNLLPKSLFYRFLAIGKYTKL